MSEETDKACEITMECPRCTHTIPNFLAMEFRAQLKAKDEALRELSRVVGCLDPGEHGPMDGCECIPCKALKAGE